MKFAVVEGERREAQPHLSGKCPHCGDAMTARCGDVRVWHWAHRGTSTCDPWWESETEWHRDWKNQFPEAWQEFRYSKDGEVLIADVKTESGVVLEFQHPHLRQNERESRENFYPKMVWVVNGRRLKRDRARFFASLNAGIVVNREPRIVSVLWKEGALLRDWEPSRAPEYFDFGDSEQGDTARFETPTLWRLNPCGPNGTAYLSAVPKTLFLHAHVKGLPFEEMCTEAVTRAAAHHLLRQAPQSRGLPGFERYMARRQRARRRF
jgi:competence protein CoiA